VPPPASHGATASAAFYKALETGVPHNGRRVKIDYSQSASPHDKGRRQNMNDGTRDIGNSQAPVLLFRGLDPLTGPQAISQAMRASSGLGKEGAKGMKRIIVIKDKVTMASFGFAFIEFIDVQVTDNTFLGLTRPFTYELSLHPPRSLPPCHLRFTLLAFVYRTNRSLRPSLMHIPFNQPLSS
jgi:RNA-binding protein 5/10